MKFLYNNNRMSFYCFQKCTRSFFIQEVTLDDVEGFFGFKYAMMFTGVYISFYCSKIAKNPHSIYMHTQQRE